MASIPRLVRASAAGATVLMAGALAAQEAASGPTPRDLAVQFSLGGQYRQDLEGRYARFLDYREVPRGAVFEFGRLDWTPRDRAWSLAFTGRNALRDDQRYDLDLRRSGRLRLQLGWQQTPRFFSNDATTLFQHGDGGDLTIPASLRSGLESGAQTSVATLAGLVPATLAGSGATIARS